MGKRILIADDLSFIRMLQKEMLTEGGFQIVGEAANGREAVESTAPWRRTWSSWTSPCPR